MVVMDTSNGGSPGGNNKLDQSEVDAFEDPVIINSIGSYITMNLYYLFIFYHF